MKILLVDISGKILHFDFMLANAIESISKNQHEVLCMCPYENSEYEEVLKDYKNGKCRLRRLVKLVPSKYSMSASIAKRMVKVVEGVMNYIYLILYTCFKRPDVIHFAWLPFVDYIAIEKYFLAAIKHVSPKTKLVLTVHDILPHDIPEERVPKYIERFKYVTEPINYFIVHTDSCRKEMNSYFGFDLDRIHLAYHPLYLPNEEMADRSLSNGEIRKLVLVGRQEPYKGTDLFIEALQKLSKHIVDKLEIYIVGSMRKDYYEECKQKADGLNIKWEPLKVPLKHLNKRIKESDLLVLPYRSISQSGILLTSLYFKRPILASNLPAFRETLCGFTDDMFCEPNDVNSLKATLENYLTGKVDIRNQLRIIDQLHDLYSWQSYARKHIEVFEK